MKQKQLNKPPPKIKSLMIRLIHQPITVLKYILLCFSRLFKINIGRCRKYKCRTIIMRLALKNPTSHERFILSKNTVVMIVFNSFYHNFTLNQNKKLFFNYENI